MIQSALLAVFLVSSSAAWGQECHTQCVYVPLEEGCQLMLEGSGEPWPVDRTLRVAASCLGDCWHPSQGKQPGAPPFWVPAEFFAPSALQIPWVGAEGAGRPSPRVGEQVPVAAALESTCDLTAVFLLEGELEGDTTYAILGPSEHSHEVTPFGEVRTGPPLPAVEGDDTALPPTKGKGASTEAGCGCSSRGAAGPWGGLLLALWSRKRLPEPRGGVR